MSESSTTLREAVDRGTFDVLRDAVAEFHRCCDVLPAADSTGKLRGKAWRLEASLKEAEQSGDLSALQADAKAAEELVRRLMDADPLTQLLRCVATLNEKVSSGNQAPAAAEPAER